MRIPDSQHTDAQHTDHRHDDADRRADADGEHTHHLGPAATPAAVNFEVRLRDGSVEAVEGADAYQQEQSMTTFFRTDGRQVVDCWSVRVASIRTDQILSVRRHEAVAGASVTVLRTA